MFEKGNKVGKQFDIIENLKGTDKEQAIANRRKGGKKSQQVQAERRSFQADTEAMLKWAIRTEKVITVDSVMSMADAKGKNITVQAAMILVQIQQALRGNTKSFEIIRDTVGEKPKEQIMIENRNSQLDNIKEQLDDVVIEGVDDVSSSE